MPRNQDNDEMELSEIGALNPNQMLSSLFSMLGIGEYQAEEAARTFFQAWSEGNYDSAFGQLATDSPLREGLARAEWAARRKAWVEQTQASNLVFDVVLPKYEEDEEDDEDEDEARGRIIELRTALKTRIEDAEDDEDEDDEDEEEEEEDIGPKEVEVFWSLQIPTAAAASLPEIPTPTIVLQENGNNWFWSSCTMVKEGEAWLLQTLSDEGANALALPIEEIQERQDALIVRVGELVDAIESEIEEDDDEDEELEDEDEELEDEDFADLEFAELASQVQESLWLTQRALYYWDVLLTKTGSDSELYFTAYDQASTFQQFERAAAYAQLEGERHPENRANALRDYAVAVMNQSDLLLSEEELEDSERVEILDAYSKRAERALRTAMALDEHPQSSILLANIFIRQGTRLDEANELLQQVKSRELDEMTRSFVALGEAHLAQARDDAPAALTHFKEAAALNPETPHVWFHIGHYQREMGELDEAEESLQRSIEANPQEEQAYAELAALHIMKNDVDGAQELLEDGLEFNPDSVELLAALSLVHSTKGDLASAEEFLDEAEEIDTEHYLVVQAREQFERVRDLKRQQQRSKGKGKPGPQSTKKKKK